MSESELDALDKGMAALLEGKESSSKLWKKIFEEFKVSGEKSVGSYIERQCTQKKQAIESSIEQCKALRPPRTEHE